MTTLHALRRRHNLSLSDLARLTGISMRRLAEYEYESLPLGRTEYEAVAAYFHVHTRSISSGVTVALPGADRSSLQPDQAYSLAAMAATAALVLALRLSLASPTLLKVQPRDEASRGAPITRALPVHQAATPQRPIPTAVRTERVVVAPVAPVASSVQVVEVVAPHLCPIDVDHGSVVRLGAQDAAASAVITGLNLAVDTNGDGYPELGATRGATVVATHAGTVTVALNTWPAGNTVTIDGSDGWRSDYEHLQVIEVDTGDHVVAGQRLGVVGNTGLAGGPQLRVEVWHNATRVDPAPLLHCR